MLGLMQWNAFRANGLRPAVPLAHSVSIAQWRVTMPVLASSNQRKQSRVFRYLSTVGTARPMGRKGCDEKAGLQRDVMSWMPNMVLVRV